MQKRPANSFAGLKDSDTLLFVTDPNKYRYPGGKYPGGFSFFRNRFFIYSVFGLLTLRAYFGLFHRLL